MPFWTLLGTVVWLAAACSARPALDARQLAAVTLTGEGSGQATGTSAGISTTTLPWSSISTALIVLASILGLAFVILVAFFTRCLILRRRSGHPPTLRSVFVPNGLHINSLRIHIDAPAPRAPIPRQSPTSPRPPRRSRGRASRRAAFGPGIAEGGRRLDSGEGHSGDEELPVYVGKEGRPPAYARHHSVSEGCEEVEDTVAAYELRTRFASSLAEMPIAPTPTFDPRAQFAMRGARESVHSYASTSAETIRDDNKDNDKELPSSP